MLRIRAAQFQAFEEQVFMPRYEATILACMREFHVAAAEVDDAVLLARIRRCTARARQHGAPDAVAWGEWAELAMSLGDDFDAAPWAAKILAGDQVWADRFAALLAAADAQLDAFEG